MNSAHNLTDTEINNLIKKGTGPKLTAEDIEAQIVKEQFHRHEGTRVTTCVLTLKNGFAVTGESSCVSDTNFNEETGRGIARKNAKEKVWELEGYALRTKLSLIEQAQPPKVVDGAVKTYVGTKVVHATPMTRLVYNNVRGWQLPDNEDGNDMGYLIELADGSGFVQWLPQDVFEEAYTHGVTLKKTTHVERMVKELVELSDKVEKLGKFTEGSVFSGLPMIERQDMMEQLHAMTMYETVLTRRLQRAQDKS